jgi:hypothetical protein
LRHTDVRAAEPANENETVGGVSLL